METVRLRLVFDSISSRSLKTERMERCWVLLKPQLQTISDFISHLLHTFDLHHSCPYGLNLFMEGFILPPFESTTILKDKDIVHVKKKKRNRKRETYSVIINNDDGVDSLDMVEIVEKQPASTPTKLLASEEFEKESGGYQSEPEEGSPKLVLDRFHVEHSSKSQRVSKKRKVSKELRGCKASLVPEKDSGTLEASFPCGSHKLPSRSARRKRAKRQWLREKLKAEKEEQHQKQTLKDIKQQFHEVSDDKDYEESTRKENLKNSEISEKENLKVDCHKVHQDTDTEDDIVPIVIRPGHIRFEPLEKEGIDLAVQENQVLMENFKWNGKMSKKKGQKWGKEKSASYRGNQNGNLSQECSRIVAVEENLAYDHANFDTLVQSSSLPKEGCVIAYRLVQLSSSWTPELSSFLIGKISKCYPESNRIKLSPLEKYPLIPEMMTDDDLPALLPDGSSCNADGSLEIDFSQLHDVRHVNEANINSLSLDAAGDINARVDSLTSIGNEAQVQPQENEEAMAWEEINQALDAKKAQLNQEAGSQTKPEHSGRSPWCHKSLRSSTLGPTMALLREQNAL